ncbi:hypothetical protein EXIGLDRAFT_763603 [Exidia glandulosa HHB12029]|uniref:Uncharacterized protein n=1 Tax=Exidia glandulosa HHB12029 TaxID=1314781 RepID=A0A165LTB7_EXIGL|nr:hypothetical protein EXIGLDRAFT_763603 [Exidia glandulosa HHB12029]
MVSSPSSLSLPNASPGDAYRGPAGASVCAHDYDDRPLAGAAPSSVSQACLDAVTVATHNTYDAESSSGQIPEPTMFKPVCRHPAPARSVRFKHPTLHELSTDRIPAAERPHVTHLNAGLDMSTSDILAYYPYLQSLVVHTLYVDSRDRLPDSLKTLFIADSVQVRNIADLDEEESVFRIAYALAYVKNLYFDDPRWAHDHLVCGHGCRTEHCDEAGHARYVRLIGLRSLSLRAITLEDRALVQRVFDGLSWINSSWLHKHVHFACDRTPIDTRALDPQPLPLGISSSIAFQYTCHKDTAPLSVALWGLDAQGTELGVWKGDPSDAETALICRIPRRRPPRPANRTVTVDSDEEKETRKEVIVQRVRKIVEKVTRRDDEHWNGLHNDKLSGDEMYKLISSHDL